MRVFVTGGTGLIGSAVITELLGHGHSVLALARSDSSAGTLEAAGASTLRGSIGDLDVLRAGAEQSEGVIHLAFDHDAFTADAFARGIAEEAAAYAAFGEVLIGSDRPLIANSGTPRVAGRVSDETDPLPSEGPIVARARAVTAVLELASQGVRSAAVRLPRTVHNHGAGGFAGLMTQTARRTGVSGYAGDGTQRWPAVHALDAAVLFRLVLEGAPAGTAWHAVDDEGVVVREIAEVIGRRLGLPVQPVPAETYGPVGPIFAQDQPSSSAATRQALGWTPTHPRLLADLENIEP